MSKLAACLTSEEGRRKDEREDGRLLDLREEVDHEQDEAVRAKRAAVRVVDLPSFGPDLDCRRVGDAGDATR